MALRLQIISRHRQGLGDRSGKEFGHDGGTIGRSLESDWVLPDGQRYISSRHASIDYRSGSFYIVDTSTNGVYVNESDRPVGRGNPQRLFPGDRVRLGEYEISVEIDEEENTNSQLATGEYMDPVSRAQRVPPPDPTRADMVQPHEITAVGIEMMLDESAASENIRSLAKRNAASLRLEDEPPPPKHKAPPPKAPPAPATAASTKAAEPPPVSAAARVAKPAPKAPPAQKPAKSAANGAATAAAANGAAPAPARPAPPPTNVALEAFFRGAGLPAQRLDDKQAEQVLHRLGQLMRETIVGLTENLHVRTDQRTALRVPNTTIQPQANNPLKFSAGVEEALNNLLFRGDSAEYLPAVEAVRAAFVDIKAHQQTLHAAMRVAIADYVARLDPDELENKVSNGKRGGLMNAANKLKYWDLFKDLYQVVTQSQPGQLPQQFLEELARAYDAESARTGGPSSKKPTARVVG